MTHRQHHAHSSPAAQRIAEQYTILRAQVGSGVHGTAVAGNDDRDEMGICLEPARYVTGVSGVPSSADPHHGWVPFEQYEYHSAWERPGALKNRSGHGDIDVTIYSARKWCRLAMAGNPSVLTLLHTPEHEIVHITDAGRELLDNADRFASRLAGDRFLGYLLAQRKGMVGERNVDVKRPELVAAHGYDCYSDDTEFLTRSGWKLYDKIGHFDALATIAADGRIEFQMPTDRVAKDYHGPMVHVRHRYTDALVTSNHRMLVSRVNRGPSGAFGGSYRPEFANWQFLPAGDLTRHMWHVRVAGVPRGGELDIPDSTLEVYGAYVSEGCVAKRASGSPSVLSFTQNIGGRLESHLADIAAVHPVRQYRYPPRGNCKPHTITTLANRKLARAVAVECNEGSHNKRLPPWAFDLSARQADILLAAMLDGDGTLTRTGYWVYYTMSRQLAGDVQALAVISGRRSNMWGPYTSGKGIYQVMIQERGREIEALRSITNLRQIETSARRVVCFTVPNETLVTRRNGRVAMHGNSKYASHALRLGFQGIEYLETGKITLPVPEPHLTYLRGVRGGERTLAEVLLVVDDLADQLRQLLPISPLPDHPDREWIDGWLHRSYLGAWGPGQFRLG